MMGHHASRADMQPHLAAELADVNVIASIPVKAVLQQRHRCRRRISGHGQVRNAALTQTNQHLQGLPIVQLVGGHLLSKHACCRSLAYLFCFARVDTRLRLPAPRWA